MFAPKSYVRKTTVPPFYRRSYTAVSTLPSATPPINEFRKKRMFKRKIIKRRTYRKRRSYRKRAPRTSIIKVRGDNFIPDAMITRLSWGGSQIASSTSTLQTQVFRLNGAQDPSTGVGTTQPAGYDQYAAFYDKYRVYGLLAEAWIINRTGSAGIDFAFSAQLNTSTPAYTTFDQIVQDRSCKYKDSPTGVRTYVKKYFSVAKVVGISKTNMDVDDVYEAPVTGLPSYEVYLVSYSRSSDATTAQTWDIQYRLTYYIKFYGRKRITDSMFKEMSAISNNINSDDETESVVSMDRLTKSDIQTLKAIKAKK